MYKKRCMFVVMLILILVVVSGCVWKQTRLDREWGSSFDAAKVNQIMNLEAGKAAIVTGLDGRIADVTIQNYNRTGSNVYKTTAADSAKATTSMGITAPTN